MLIFADTLMLRQPCHDFCYAAAAISPLIFSRYVMLRLEMLLY